MDISILKSYEEVKPHIDRVVEEADNNKDALGFLAHSAYHELAYKNQLLIAYCNEKDDVVGHLLFGGRYPSIRVKQILVYNKNKRSGIGEHLLKALVSFGEKNNHISIIARVAADLKANTFWERMGFNLIKQEKGGKSRDRIINVRVKELNSMTLFSGFDAAIISDRKLEYNDKPTLTTSTYAIDLNVFFDVTRKRSINSVEVIRAGLNNKVKLCVTHEFIAELERNIKKFGLDDPVLEFAKGLPTLLTVDDSDIFSLKSELRAIVFPHKPLKCKSSENDKSDLIHLSSCIHHKLKGFITKEKAILKNANEIKNIYGIEIISPSDLEDDDEFKLTDLSVDVEDQIIEINEMSENIRIDVERFLISQGVNDELLSEVLNSGTVDTPRRRLITRSNNNIIGVTSWEPSNKYNAVSSAYIYVDESDRAAIKVIDHVISQICMDSKLDNLIRVNLYTLPTNSRTIETAIDRGFRKINKNSHGELSKVTYGGIVTEEKWGKFKEEYRMLTGFLFEGRMPTYEEFLNTGLILSDGKNNYGVKLFEFETMISPGILLCKNRTSVIVPIQQSYAEQLFVEIRKQKDMFPSKESLLHIEKSYFRTARSVEKFSKSMLMIFYVSGKNKGLMEAIGVARITYSGKVTPEDAEINFSRQGALTAEELKNIGDKNNNIHAITFDNFSLFPNKISYDVLKSIGCVSDANLITADFLKFDNLKSIFNIAYE